MRNQRGITLVALVVTIIILIILAGVSINMVVGDNGIITQAQRAARETANVTIASEDQMNALVEELKQHLINESDALKLQAGDYIKYDSGVNGEIVCRVLYPADSEYGLQIISNESVKNVTLGGNTFEEGRISYNNAIQNLNKEAEPYLNTKYATDVRCVGSVPTIDDKGIFVDKNHEVQGPVTMRISYNGSNIIDCKNTDGNSRIDTEQMVNIDIYTTKDICWLASREVNSGDSFCQFYMCITGANIYRDLCQIDSYGQRGIGYLRTFGFRPCIALRTDIKITGGDGKTEGTAYTIGI